MSFSSWIPSFVSSTASSLFASISVPSHTPLVPSSFPQDLFLEDESTSSESPPEKTLFRKSFDPVVALETETKHASKVTFEKPSILVQPSIPTIAVRPSPSKLPPPPPSISLPSEDSEDLEDDSPPPFPLLNSAQRSSAPSTCSTPSLSVQAPPSFTITPPSALRLIDDEDDGGSSSLGAGLGGREGGKKSLATPTTTTKVFKARGKVALSPGHSPLDWARVKSSGRYDGRSLKGDIDHFPVRVTPSLLKEHNGRNGNDAWSVFQGRVYNITPYMKFHPGGEKELLRTAGRDGTKLFMATHAWVNLDMMIDACLVGMMVSE